MRVVTLGVRLRVRPGIDPSQDSYLLLAQELGAVRHGTSGAELRAWPFRGASAVCDTGLSQEIGGA